MNTKRILAKSSCGLIFFPTSTVKYIRIPCGHVRSLPLRLEGQWSLGSYQAWSELLGSLPASILLLPFGGCIQCHTTGIGQAILLTNHLRGLFHDVFEVIHF